MKIQLFDEIHPLEEVLVWGEPGIEVLLGQLLPKSKSLFFSYYDVQEARREFRHMQELIEGEEIKVTRAKDALVKTLSTTEIPGEPKSLAEAEQKLLQRAGEYYETYREHKIADFSNEGIHGDIDEVYFQVQQEIKQILREDVQAYGEAGAIRLNHMLSLSHELPLANIFYGRDQSQSLTDRIVLSALKWDIRKPEVEVFKHALRELGYENGFVEVNHGTIEGGDIAILGDTCYIGIGARTTLSAVKNLSKKIGTDMERQGIQIVAVINKRHVEEAALYGAPTEEHMRIMHLDMFWIPLAPNLVMAYGHELDRREVIRISRNMHSFIIEELGGFREFLSAKGIEILEVDEAEQKNFATNLLNLGNKTVIMALSTNQRVIQELQKRGFRVLSAELNKLVNGYGAVHCLTAPVRRTLKSVTSKTG
ncbi:MAG: arginine deiminase family protein [Anaerolineales bacterium]|nr:MAG: arginine deiminase family protein [Anaerolineales bacterium]